MTIGPVVTNIYCKGCTGHGHHVKENCSTVKKIDKLVKDNPVYKQMWAVVKNGSRVNPIPNNGLSAIIKHQGAKKAIETVINNHKQVGEHLDNKVMFSEMWNQGIAEAGTAATNLFDGVN